MNYNKESTLISGDITIVNYLHEIGGDSAKEEIFNGLKTTPKIISSKFFYNERGSKLFEQITELDEYYLTRTEKSILSIINESLNLNFSDLSIVELGSGDPSKIRLLLEQIPKKDLPTIKYFPVDISSSAINGSSRQLAEEFPTLRINGIVADFIHQLHIIPKIQRRLFCFFGSTIGNLDKSEQKDFMILLSSVMQQGDSLLLGLDMIKDISVLEKAYNDDKKITAEFNKNILNVINNLAGLNFNPMEFEHIAFYNNVKHRIEMHLKALKEVEINLSNGADTPIIIKEGERIHTENSHKFNSDDIQTIGTWACLDVEKIITDENQWFNLVHYRKNNL